MNIPKIVTSSVVNAVPVCFLGKNSYEKVKMFALCSVFSSLSIYINQNVTDDEIIQLGMIPAEAIISLSFYNGLLKEQTFFENFVSSFWNLTFNPPKRDAVILTTLSFIHKYIWDQPDYDVTVELYQPTDLTYEIKLTLHPLAEISDDASEMI